MTKNLFILISLVKLLHSGRKYSNWLSSRVVKHNIEKVCALNKYIDCILGNPDLILDECIEHGMSWLWQYLWKKIFSCE